MDERELSWNNTPMYFWALCVWSYEDNAVKVWMPTQSSILNKIKNLALLKRKNAKGELIPVWGSPTTFDLTIVKTVYGDSTEYMVNPNPQSDMPKNALELLKEADITMSNIFEGRYPMANTPKLAEEVAQGNSYSFQQNSPFTPADEDTLYHQNPPKKNVEKHKPARPANLDKAEKDEQLLLHMVDNFKRKCSDFANREDESGFEVEELQKLYTDIDDLAKTIDPQTMVQLIESANYVLGMYDMESIGARKK